MTGADTPADAGNPSRRMRAEDAIDPVAVGSWLTEVAGIEGVPEIRQFPGGASNLTYLLRYPGRELILRRPPGGTKAKGAHDMGREFRIQSALASGFAKVPEMIGFCADDAVLGSEFYVMAKLEGTILRKDFPQSWSVSASEAGELCRRLMDTLVELHATDVEAVGLAGLGKGEGYVARQVSGWSRRYRDAVTEDVGDLESLMSWLAVNQPEDTASCLIHNDYRFDNLVLDGDREVVGVLDWEMATVGDPLMDLSAVTAYWIEAGDDATYQMFRRQPTTAPGMWTRRQLTDYYAERTGRAVTPEGWLFYEVFGLFRLCVIMQQIYYRYVHGQTTNPAYAVMGEANRYLAGRANRILEGAGA